MNLLYKNLFCFSLLIGSAYAGPTPPAGVTPITQIVRLTEVSEDGFRIQLSDGFVWQVGDWRKVWANRWQAGDKIEVIYMGTSDSAPTYLVNLHRQRSLHQEKWLKYEWVSVSPYQGAKEEEPLVIVDDPYSYTIRDIRDEGKTLELHDGTIWKIMTVRIPGDCITANCEDFVNAWGIDTQVRISHRNGGGSWGSQIYLHAVNKSWQNWIVEVAFVGMNQSNKTLYTAEVSDAGRKLTLGDGSRWSANGWHANWYHWQAGEIVLLGFNADHGIGGDPNMIINVLRRMEDHLGDHNRYQFESVVLLRE